MVRTDEELPGVTNMTRLKRRKRNGEVEARRAKKRIELLDAAIRAIRREGPGVSMGEMAAEAGVTKPILYRHFGAKGGLYHAIAERYATELLTRSGRPWPGTSLRETCWWPRSTPTWGS